jgi:hypothetical protein
MFLGVILTLSTIGLLVIEAATLDGAIDEE